MGEYREIRVPGTSTQHSDGASFWSELFTMHECQRCWLFTRNREGHDTWHDEFADYVGSMRRWRADVRIPEGTTATVVSDTIAPIRPPDHPGLP